MTNPENKQKPKQIKPGSWDDAYIEAYVNNPKGGKCGALREAGYEGEYLTQEACRIHKRLADRIHQAFSEKLKDLEGMAIDNIKSLLKTPIKDIGATTMLAASKTALDYAGRKPGDTLTIKQEQTIDDLDTANSELIKQIAQDEGKTIAQVINELEKPASNSIN